MRCAVDNSIDNGFNYGKAPVVVRLKRNQDSVSIEFWDQGSGIPSAQWERALLPFQRLDEARSALVHCGVGLAIFSEANLKSIIPTMRLKYRINLQQESAFQSLKKSANQRHTKPIISIKVETIYYNNSKAALDQLLPQ